MGLKLQVCVGLVLLSIISISGCGKITYEASADGEFESSSAVSRVPSNSECGNPIPVITGEMPDISSSHRWYDGNAGYWQFMRSVTFAVHEGNRDSFVAETVVRRDERGLPRESYQRLLCGSLRPNDRLRAQTRTVESISRFDGSYQSDREISYLVNAMGALQMESQIISHSGFASSLPTFFLSNTTRIYRRSYREVEMRYEIFLDSGDSDGNFIRLVVANIYQFFGPSI